MNKRIGYNKLWNWFGIDRASFLTLPRVLMHEMPDNWQAKMAKLLEEYDDAFPGIYGDGVSHPTVQARKNGRLIRWPEWLLNYRYPDKETIDQLRKP